MLKVQEYLLSGKTHQDLTNEFGIKVRDYPEDGVVVLNYCQIDSPKSHPIVIECRSLVLGREEPVVVSVRFDRFFNLGECPDLYQGFDISKTRILEKADGSLVSFCHNPFTDRFEISTRSMFKAEGEHIFGGTFRSKILEAAGFSCEEEFQEWAIQNLSRNNTHIFEWVSPENRIVTRYDSSHLVLLGVRSNVTLKEYNWGALTAFFERIQKGVNIRLPKTYDPAVDTQEIVKRANELTGLEEGFIAWCEETNRRVKVKAANYLIAHRLRGETTIPTRKNLLELVLEGEVDEFLCYFPEYEKHVNPIREEVNSLEEQLRGSWLEFRDIVDQKEFALAIKSVPANSILFSTRKLGIEDPVKYLHTLDVNKKLRLFGV